MSESKPQAEHQPGQRYRFKQRLRVEALPLPLPVGVLPATLTFEEGLYRYPSREGYGFEGAPLEHPERVYYFVLPSLLEVETDPLPLN